MTPDSSSDVLLRTKLTVAKARIAAAERADEARVQFGAALARAGRRAILGVHRGERVDVPMPFSSADTTFDVVADLREYTGLPGEVVDELLRRRGDSFRAEWFMTPERQRTDEWFYLSSAMYLFGNAAHDPRPLAALLGRLSLPTGRILEFGGGSGNLALALAAAGHSVDYVERSALQKDFVSFRIDRHGLTDGVRVLDHWQPIDRDAYAAVIAVDVLEHIEALARLLRDELLPSIRQHGLLVESSPFSRNMSNPMHHEHRDFDELMKVSGFGLESGAEETTRLWRRT